MLLRAEPIGQPPSRRWVILDIEEYTVWTGEGFVEDWKSGRKYAHPSDACGEMADILKKVYGALEKQTFVVPVEVEVFGSTTPGKVARYLYNASILNVQTSEYGNGPGESLVLPTIHWGKIRKIEESELSPDAQQPATQSGLEDENESE